MYIIEPLSVNLEQKQFRKQAFISSVLDISIFICTLFFASIFKHSLPLILTFNILAFIFASALFISTFYSQKWAMELSQANTLIQFTFTFSYILMFILYSIE